MKTFDVVYDWFINVDARLEMSEWMYENIKHGYTNHHRYCDIYCFNDEIDAMAFKLRWL